MLGGVLGWLAGIGALAIPGVGPLIAAGPIMGLLSGAAVGAATGGLTGALVGYGMPEIEAKRYEGKVKSGNILLSVHTEDADEVARVKEIFQTHRAEDIAYTGESKVLAKGGAKEGKVAIGATTHELRSPYTARDAPSFRQRMSAASRAVLLTGATGFVGKVVLEELLRRRAELGIERVLALVRANDPEHAAARCRADVVSSACFAAHPLGWEKRIEALPGDVTKPGLGLSAETQARVATEVTHVIHCAASVEFTRPLAEALAVNTQGALHALEVARACSRLESYVAVSTAYVTPHPDPYGRSIHRVEEVLAPLPRDPEALYASLLAGTEDEKRLLAETGHPNTYTLTKCLAEHLTARRAGDLPVTLIRPSIVSACRTHPMPGWIDSAAAFAGFVVMIGTGKLRVLAGYPNARLDVVPCDAVAKRIVAAAFAPPRRGAPRIQHVVAGLEGAVPLSLCGERIVSWFRNHPAGRRARLDYVGPRGPAFRAAHALRHELPARGVALWLELSSQGAHARAVRKLVQRQRTMNTDFAYFTHATLDFVSSAPTEPAVEPIRYLDTVCEGVSRHLMRRDRPRRAQPAQSTTERSP